MQSCRRSTDGFGCDIEDYAYNESLLNRYSEMLGEGFVGFRLHEWMSNYRGDLRKLENHSSGLGQHCTKLFFMVY